MMHQLLRILLVCSLVVPPLAAASDDPLVIIVNSRNPTPRVGVTEVKNLFTGNVSFWQGTVPVTLVVRPPDSEVGARFLDDVLDSTSQRFDASWQARQLAGRGVAPRIATAADDVVEVVARTPGAIGYILTSEIWSELPAGVKILEID